MPAHKGVEPFSRFWTVNYSVIRVSARIEAGTALTRNRLRVFGNKDDADAFYQSLLDTAKVAEGYPAPGTIFRPFLEKFYNRKDFITVFINEHADEVAAGV